MPREAFVICGERVEPGARRTIDLPVSLLSDHTPVTMSAHVVHGRRPGPTLFVSAAVHGDEVIGVEIARRLLRAAQLKNIRGTLIVVPVVNAFGFLNQSRYLPDRRDLNRSFPGRAQGSLASRIAQIFMSEIVERSDFGIDLHSAAIHRTNLPQIRYSAAKEETTRYAEAFGAPITIRSKMRPGSLRQAAQDCGVDVLLFEAGEALRFDEFSARVGLAGILRVMHAMSMIPRKGIPIARTKSVEALSSSWVRASAGGLLRTHKASGEIVKAEELLGVVSDPFGETEVPVTADKPGVIVGRTNLPVVNEGDALFHIAEMRSPGSGAAMDVLATQLDSDSMFDEDEII